MDELVLTDSPIIIRVYGLEEHAYLRPIQPQMFHAVLKLYRIELAISGVVHLVEGKSKLCRVELEELGSPQSFAFLGKFAEHTIYFFGLLLAP